jgi:hypothetical protein
MHRDSARPFEGWGIPFGKSYSQFSMERSSRVAKCALFLTHLRQFEKLGCWRFGGRENEAKSFEGCPKHPDEI